MTRRSRGLRRAAAMLRRAGILAACAVASAAAEPAPGADADLREFSVGMPLSALPASGYADLVCASPPGAGRKLGGWGDYRQCPPDGAGRHEIAFRYDDGGEHATKVAGQPVRLSVLLGEDGTLDALRIETDPSARLYQRKAAFAFGARVQARYGEDGWSCVDEPPAADQEPVGGVFVREHCEKTDGRRHLVLDRELFRIKGQEARQFTSRTTFTVSLKGGEPKPADPDG